jgi:hypothetical protein
MNTKIKKNWRKPLITKALSIKQTYSGRGNRTLDGGAAPDKWLS